MITSLALIERFLNIRYHLISDKPVDVYVVPNPKQYDLIAENKNFKYYSDCSKKGIEVYNGKCNMLPENGGIVVLSKENTKINIELKYYYEYEDDSKITYYNINGENCIVLDPTAGKFGYPGYDNNLTGRKIATDGNVYYYLS